LSKFVGFLGLLPYLKNDDFIEGVAFEAAEILMQTFLSAANCAEVAGPDKRFEVSELLHIYWNLLRDGN
jgi:hypothetical protein